MLYKIFLSLLDAFTIMDHLHHSKEIFGQLKYIQMYGMTTQDTLNTISVGLMIHGGRNISVYRCVIFMVVKKL